MDCRERILSNNTFDYITDFPIESSVNPALVFCYEDIEGMYNIAYLNRSLIPDLEANFFEYQSIPKLYGLMQIGPSGGGDVFDPSALIASGITRVQRPPLSLTGRGTIICIADTGIDYTLPVFRDENGNTRILAIWDQTIQDGPAPEGFQYGTEYTEADINWALQSEDPFRIVPSRDENGHGTMLAALAAGKSTQPGNSYLGAAPEAGLVIVKLKEAKPYLRNYYLVPENVAAYQENDIMLAAKYGNRFVDFYVRPVVFCLGLGTNMGDHNGTSFLSEYLGRIARQRSSAVVVTGGNEGNAGHHFQGDLAGAGASVTADGMLYQDVEIRVGEGSRGFFLELWGNLPDIVNVSIRTPGGETIPRIRLGGRQSITYGFIYEQSQVTVDASVVEPSSGEELILFRLVTPTPGIWTFRVSGTTTLYNGVFHMWLPIRDFLDTEVYFLSPSPYVTLTEPSMASDVICVSTYNSDNGSFYIESGRGFAQNGAIRPDLAAPGVNVSTIRGKSTGASLAAAITAGAVAQLLQWAVVERNDELAGSREIRSYLVLGASRTAGQTYPNREWGYGKLNMGGTFDALVGV